MPTVPARRISENDICAPGYPRCPAPAATLRAGLDRRYLYVMVCPSRRGQDGGPWPRTSSRLSRPVSGRLSRTEVSASRLVPLLAPIKPTPRMPRHGRASAALAGAARRDDEDDLNAYVEKGNLSA